eukprot:5048540-Amphidinium_carterae.1
MAGCGSDIHHISANYHCAGSSANVRISVVNNSEQLLVRIMQQSCSPLLLVRLGLTMSSAVIVITFTQKVMSEIIVIIKSVMRLVIRVSILRKQEKIRSKPENHTCQKAQRQIKFKGLSSLHINPVNLHVKDFLPLRLKGEVSPSPGQTTSCHSSELRNRD